MLRRRLATSLAICALPLALAACGGADASDPRTVTPLVRTAVVQEAKPGSRSFTGVVAARAQSDVGFRVSGKVVERLVDAGDQVRRGQPLMRIDATDLKLAADAEDEAADAARARLRQAEEAEDRYGDLRDSGTVSDSEYDESKAAADAAEDAAEAAEDQAEIVRNASRYAQLVAEADGVVVETLAEPGDVVGAGEPVVRVAGGGPREAVIQLPETLRPEIGSTGQAALFGKEDATAPAELRQVSGAADRVTRTFEARFVLEGDLADAPLGATVTIELNGEADETTQDALQVPIGAVLDAGKGSGVWVVEGATPKTSWRPVTIQRIDDDSMYVSGDIEPGERVVALGAHLIRDGQRVRLAQSEATDHGARR